MAKFTMRLNADFDRFLLALHEGILNGSASASFEDGSDWSAGNSRCAVRVYERYSTLGGNRVSLNITLTGCGRDLFLTAITSGGSQAMLFKLNTLGEHSFLQCAEKIANNYRE